MDIKKKAYAFVIITLFAGALIPILLTVSRSTNIYEFFFGIYAVSLVASLAFLAYMGKVGELSKILREPKKVAIICLIGLVSYLPIGFGIAYAEKFIAASLVTAIFRTSPLLMLLLLPPLLREKLSKYQIAALVLAFVGLYIGVSAGNPMGVLQNSDLGIVVFMILMAFGYALSMILIKRYVFDISVVIAISMMAMFALFAVLMVINGFPLYAMTLPQISVVLYMGVISNVFSFYMYFTSLRPIKTTLFANVYFLSPFITFIFAYLFLGEVIQSYYIAIALFAGAGIILQGFDKTGGGYLASSKEGNVWRMAIFDVTGIFANTGEIGINSAIKDGGRILAVKLDGRYGGRVNDLIAEEETEGVYMDSHEEIADESRYVKDVLGAKSGDIVVMKAGTLEECERFFENLYGRIKPE